MKFGKIDGKQDKGALVQRSHGRCPHPLGSPSAISILSFPCHPFTFIDWVTYGLW